MLPKDSRQVLQYVLHTVVYDTCFSPCGRYLAAANKFGDLALFSLSAALSPDVRDEAKCPIFSFNVCKNGGVYCLTSTDSVLICAGENGIQAYKWSDIISKSALEPNQYCLACRTTVQTSLSYHQGRHKVGVSNCAAHCLSILLTILLFPQNPKVAWALSIPTKGVFSHPEINSCVVSENNGQCSVYAGAGDNMIHVWDLEAGTYMESLNGHTDYIHSVCLKDEGRGLISASEDGTARIWDLRAKETVHIVKPFEHEMCARPHVGKWLQCLTLDEENYWLLLGGGPTLAAWHLKTLTPTVTFDTPGVAQNVAMFYEDKIFSAGSSNIVNHWAITGEHKMGVPVSPSCVYSIGINTNSKTNKVMNIAGSSDKIDVCTNFGYKAFSLSFLPPMS